jgi:hypothetical protein
MPVTEGNQDKQISETQFWKNYIRDSISQSISNIEASGLRIQTGIGLIWTIYTTAAIVGTSLFKPGFPWYVNILIALPILIIMIAYYFTTKIQVHSVMNVDTNNTDFIKLAFNDVIREKKRLLDIALNLMLVTAIVVAVAVGFIANYQSSKTPNMQVSEVTINNEKTVSISGYFPPNTKLDYIVEYKNENNIDVHKVITLTTPTSGNVNSSISLSDKPNTYKVTVQWTGDNGLVYILQKTVKP